jgi:hypothetical protein
MNVRSGIHPVVLDRPTTASFAAFPRAAQDASAWGVQRIHSAIGYITPPRSGRGYVRLTRCPLFREKLNDRFYVETGP